MHTELQTINDADAVQTKTAGSAKQGPRFVDNRLLAVAQCELTGMLNNGLRVSQQRALTNAIHSGPRMVAQRELAEQLSTKEAEQRPDGLPHRLKAGIEQLSGISMDGVRVHYNSSHPAQLGAHAYAQGSDIHLAAGQERHLPHEAWHVVQQAQGRVRPTMQMKNGTPLNDAVDMEREADVMGARAASPAALDRPATLKGILASSSVPVQRLELSNKRHSALRKWVPEFIRAGSDEYDTIKAWFKHAIQLSFDHFDWIVTQPFENWDDDYEAGFGAAPASVTPSAFAAIGAPKAASSQPSDTLAKVRKKVAGEGLDTSKFTTQELRAIESGSGDGWGAAIHSINAQLREREANARLVADRTAKYNAAKALGDQEFQNGLIRKIWNFSYGVAVAGNSSINTTLPGAHSDADINAAALAWHHHDDLPVPPRLDEPPPEDVTNFHVPGAPTYIEDKSTRLVNRDLSRGRQADFICRWGSLNVNVHVDSTQKH